MGASTSQDSDEQFQTKLFNKNHSFLDIKNNSEQTNNRQAKQFISKILSKNERIFVKSIEFDQFQKMYVDSGQNIQKFFQLIAERISDIYINLSRKTLELMVQKKISNTQSKIIISEEVLYTSINILKTIGLKNNFKFNQQIISNLNNLQVMVLGYMKAKYPRTNQNFVPGELMQELKNFDLVQQPQNDVLKFLNICFGETNQKLLTLQVKKFLNLLLTQLDEKFPKFQQLISEKAFVVTKEGVEYTVRNKMNRKIPENVQKFIEDDCSIDLKEPQMFRVIVKWVNDMQDYILNPYDELQQKDHFKTVSPNENGINFDFVTPDQIAIYMKDFEEILTTYKKQYENQLQDLKKCIQLFNHNLIRALTKAQRKQKYVPKRQAEVIKYSMYNKKLLSWLQIEKLMIVLKKLIGASIKMEQKIGVKLDLIKFNVTNLMRASMIGNKFQIKKVFNNIRNLQNQGKIKILKIRNRLQTSLNDVIVIFKMTNSFILCQIQLILSDGNQSETDKLKSIEVLNHFFYQIERSTYGVMAQLASLIGSKDNKSTFEQKITFQKAKQMDIINCQKSHAQKVESVYHQKIPFICSVCTKFYEEDENQYIYKYCSQCNQYLCCKCLIQQGRESEKQMRSKLIVEKIKQQLDKVILFQKNNTPTSIDNHSGQHTNQQEKKWQSNIQRYLSVETQKVIREISKQKSIVSFKQLEKYVLKFYTKKSSNEIETLYFSIGQVRGGKIHFISMKYDNLNGVRYCFKYGYEDPVKQIPFKYFDFVLVHTNIQAMETSQIFIENTNINLFKNFAYPNLKQGNHKFQILTNKKTIADSTKQTQKINLIFNFVVESKDKKKTSNIMKKQFNYESIEAMRNNLPNLIQTHEIYEISDEGIEDLHLDYFKKVQWKKDIKLINLHNNKICDISPVLNNLPNLQKLLISKNFITHLKFSQKLVNFKKLIASNNQIQKIQNLQNIQTATNITLNSNNLRFFNERKFQFKQLRILDLSYNSLQKLTSMSHKHYPKLNNLLMGGAGEENNQLIILDLPNLITLELYKFGGKHLQIPYSQNLELLHFNEISFSSFKLSQTKRLKRCTIYQSYPINFQEQYKNFIMQFLNKQFPLLILLQLNSCWQMQALPVLKMPSLKTLNISQVTCNQILNLSQSELPSLQNFAIAFNGVQILPILKLPKVKYLSITNNYLMDVNNLEHWVVPSLENLQITDIDSSAVIPDIKSLSHLQELSLFGGSYKPQSTWSNPLTQKLSLNTSNCQNLPVFKMPKLTSLSLQSCHQLDLSNLQVSELQNLKLFTAQNTTIKQQKKFIPIINFPSLQEFIMTGSLLNDLSNLSISNISKITKMRFDSNSISKLQPFKFNNLQQLQLHYNRIQSVQWLNKSQLPNLKKLDLSSNIITTFPILNMALLTELNLSHCEIVNYQNISLCNIPQVESIFLNGDKNCMTVFYEVKMPNLKRFEFNHLGLKDISALERCVLDKLQSLTLNKIKLTVPTLPKLNLPSITSLNIDDSNIQNIVGLKQSNLPNLSNLFMSRSAVKQLPIMNFPLLKSLTFNGTTQLRKDGKGIYSIDNLQFSVMPLVESIYGQFNLIKRLPKMNFPKLDTLYIRQNQITNGEEFNNSYVPNLKIIHLYDNPINVIPCGKNVKPQKLYMQKAQALNFNEIGDLCNNFIQFYYNGGIVPQKLPNLQFKKLSILQFSQNQLKSINQIVKYPFPLAEEITFIDNQITKPPKLIAPKLKRLFFSRNCINDLKQFMQSQLPKIQLILLQSNEIEDLIDFPFLNISSIYLNNNKISNLSVFNKYKYNNLKLFSAYNCKLQILPKFNAPALENLYIYQNQIQSFQSMKGSFVPCLKMIQANNNKIKELKSLNQIDFPALTSIHFIDNFISKLCKLTTMPHLSEAWLTNNPIENIDDFLTGSYPNLYTFGYSLKMDEKKKLENIQRIKSKFPSMNSNFKQLKKNDQDSQSEND